MQPRILHLTLMGLMLSPLSFAGAQPAEPNYDESKVPAYTLPDPLVAMDGTTITTPAGWMQSRRQQVLSLFRQHMYGDRPRAEATLSFEKFDHDKNALDNRAVRKQVTVRFEHEQKKHSMDLLIYVPKTDRGPVPAFLGLNFRGNHTVHVDPDIRLTESWIRNDTARGITDHRATEQTRGIAASRWPIDMVIQRGYAVVTAYYGDIDPDFDDGFQNGVHPLFYAPGQERPQPNQWGSIAAWAWGLSRALDYLATDPDIDQQRVAVLGHSRLGKTALWAGAEDTRFALVISNNSGCGGAALSRRRFGETVARINQVFPHWFCQNFKQYNHREDELPFDQHMLIALIAPRPVYVASAAGDRWADPRGEFLAALHAGPVYRLLGEEPLEVTQMPPVDQPVMNTIGYHVRSGQHDITRYDWQRYLDFADRHLGTGEGN